MVLHHLLCPGSKLNAFEQQKRYVGLPEIELQHLYRALDVLCEHKETLEESLFYQNYNLLNSEIDVVFYDVTTFAFQSTNIDGLRNFGYSKDGKFNEVQVVLSMFIDKTGCPIGYELFSGNTFDSKTLTTALAALKQRFGIRRVIIVADRGINSKLNLKAIMDAGYGYIMASRLKSLPTAMKQEALALEEFQTLTWHTEDGEPVAVRYKTLPYANIVRERRVEVARLEESLLVTHSQKRAQKDATDRQRLLLKAKRLLDIPALLQGNLKRGGRKYIKATRKAHTTYSLDQTAVERDMLWDGYYAIQTSEMDLTPEKVLEAYHTLWKIEESFRIMKSTLEVRPICHWTETRIKGHFVVCFLAFLLERKLEQRLRNNHLHISPFGICEALNQLTVTRSTLDGAPIYLKSKPSQSAAQILRAMKLPQPKTVAFESTWIDICSGR